MLNFVIILLKKGKEYSLVVVVEVVVVEVLVSVVIVVVAMVTLVVDTVAGAKLDR